MPKILRNPGSGSLRANSDRFTARPLIPAMRGITMSESCFEAQSSMRREHVVGVGEEHVVGARGIQPRLRGWPGQAVEQLLQTGHGVDNGHDDSDAGAAWISSAP